MNDATFTIQSGVAIPARTIPNAGPRESKYPVDQMKQGDAFAIAVESEKQARQKQSQFSSLAKTRKITLVTRYFPSHVDSPFKDFAIDRTGVEGEGDAILAVWYDGPRVEKAKKNKAADAAEGNEAAAEQASEASAPAAAASEETVEL